ncbi:hypothetical protein [Pararhodospirillum photometricum]|uniref:Coat protein n=1 Tax=Pararhodospirillum photometricum DSM 122 TaxID=1150469 RepID=H6SRX6_PARPM|nr:hypothetical protein [Pararhodospirillum photometricum]CCG07655.1 Putative uncharacterized protein [Pararhodospirillum photometricum DSM 122]
MSTVSTRLSDVIVPEVFQPYLVQRSLELDAFVQSGVVARDAQFDALAAGGGTTFPLPFFNDLSGDSNVGSDDPDSLVAPARLTAGRDVAIKHVRNKAWSSMDLTAALLATDPLRAVADLVAPFWVRDRQKLLIASLSGVLAANVAANGGDMIHSVATDDAGAPTAAEVISDEAILAAAQTLGDMKSRLSAIALHSVVHTRLQRLGTLLPVYDPQSGDLRYQTYLGYRVIVDDGLPVTQGAHRPVYTSVLFAEGAFAYGEGQPKMPVETERVPGAGDGEGMEILHSRRHFLLHPRGIRWVGASMARPAPTNAELALAANWQRVYERKAIRIAALRTNG